MAGDCLAVSVGKRSLKSRPDLVPISRRFYKIGWSWLDAATSNAKNDVHVSTPSFTNTTGTP
jgi:hypothetical protein